MHVLRIHNFLILWRQIVHNDGHLFYFPSSIHSLSLSLFIFISVGSHFFGMFLNDFKMSILFVTDLNFVILSINDSPIVVNNIIKWIQNFLSYLFCCFDFIPGKHKIKYNISFEMHLMHSHSISNTILFTNILSVHFSNMPMCLFIQSWSGPLRAWINIKEPEWLFWSSGNNNHFLFMYLSRYTYIYIYICMHIHLYMYVNNILLTYQQWLRR